MQTETNPSVFAYARSGLCARPSLSNVVTTTVSGAALLHNGRK